MKYYATVSGHTVLVERTPDGVRFPDRELAFDAVALGPSEAHLRFLDRSERVVGRRTATGWRVWIGGREYHVELEGERARAIRELTGQDGAVETTDLRAPMPGLVVKVLVEAGQAVEAGEGLVVVEAMKMENELRAEAAGTVASVEVAAGSAVDRDELLIRFEDEA